MALINLGDLWQYQARANTVPANPGAVAVPSSGWLGPAPAPFGNDRFGYYETIGGGAGAGPGYAGASGIHTHMTNTRITDPEVLEVRYPVRLERFALRTGSGGEGLHRGGDGLVREYRFLESVTLSLLTERRCVSPWGLDGGGAGCTGRNRLRRVDGEWETLPGRCTRELNAGDLLSVETPGGGGMGRSE